MVLDNEQHSFDEAVRVVGREVFLSKRNLPIKKMPSLWIIQCKKHNFVVWIRKECNISCKASAVYESHFLFGQIIQFKHDNDKYHLSNTFGDTFDTVSTWTWVPEFEVSWPLANQLVMSPMLHDPPLLHNIYLLRLLDRRETVGDRDGGPALLGLVQRLLDHLGNIDHENWTSACPAPPSGSRRPVLT